LRARVHTDKGNNEQASGRAVFKSAHERGRAVRSGPGCGGGQYRSGSKGKWRIEVDRGETERWETARGVGSMHAFQDGTVWVVGGRDKQCGERRRWP